MLIKTIKTYKQPTGEIMITEREERETRNKHQEKRQKTRPVTDPKGQMGTALSSVNLQWPPMSIAERL